jgi:hypothetical protein
MNLSSPPRYPLVIWAGVVLAVLGGLLAALGVLLEVL